MRHLKKTVFVVSIFMLLFLCSPALAGEVIVVTSDGQAVLGEDTTPARARSLALNNARRSAIEHAVGVTVHGSSVVYNFRIISDLVSAFSRGLIVKEEILADKLKAEGQFAFYYVKIRTHVKPLKFKKPHDFRIISADVLRVGSNAVSPEPVFHNADEIQIRVATNADLFLNIFSVSEDGSIIKLLPNRYVENNKSYANTTFVFPDDIRKSMGMRLRVSVPKDTSSALETIIIIGTKEKISLLSCEDTEEPTVTDLMNELSRIDQSLWTEKVIGYVVRM